MTRPVTPCPCACHTGAFTPCDIAGGCGLDNHRDQPTAAPSCPGTCNRAHRADPSIPAVAGAPVWCDACRTRIRHALHALPKLYAQLELDKLRGTRAAGEKIGKQRKGAAVPSPSAAADEQDALVWLLTYWEDTIREARGFHARPERLAAGKDRWSVSWCRLVHGPARAGEPWPIVQTVTVSIEKPLDGPATTETATLIGAATFLNRHVDWALNHEGLALELGNDLLRARQRLQQLTKTGTQRQRMPIPCPRCELRSLVHEGGAEHMVCGNQQCGRHVPMSEYEELEQQRARRRSKAHA